MRPPSLAYNAAPHSFCSAAAPLVFTPLSSVPPSTTAVVARTRRPLSLDRPAPVCGPVSSLFFFDAARSARTCDPLPASAASAGERSRTPRVHGLSPPTLYDFQKLLRDGTRETSKWEHRARSRGRVIRGGAGEGPLIWRNEVLLRADFLLRPPSNSSPRVLINSHLESRPRTRRGVPLSCSAHRCACVERSSRYVEHFNGRR